MSASQVKCVDMSGIDPYSEYKDSDIIWIGEVPRHWNLSRLKYLSNIKTGERDTIDKDDNGEYPFFVRSQTVERINSYSYDGEAILTAGDGVGVGKVFHYYEGRFNYHQRVYKISDFTKVLGKYLFYYMRENFHKEVLKISAKSTVDSLRLPMFLDFPVAYGTIEEQQAIVNFLDRETAQIDTLVEKKQHFIELLEEKRAALISHTVTKGLDPDVPMKDSGVQWIGEIPEGWDVKRLKYISNILFSNVDKKSYEDEKEVLSCNYTDVYNNEFITRDIDFLKITANDNEISRFVIQKGDVIVTKDSETAEDIAVPAYVKEDLDEVLCGYHLAIIRPKNIDGKYLFRIFQSNICDHFTVYARGVTRFGLGFDAFNSTVIPFIPLSEQKAIASYLDRETAQIDTLIEKIKQSIELLKEYRTALIYDAVTGKIDVRRTACE